MMSAQIVWHLSLAALIALAALGLMLILWLYRAPLLEIYLGSWLLC